MIAILPAAFLALSVHVLPAIAFAFPSPQSSVDQCMSTSACTNVVNALTSCNVDTSASDFTTAQERCLCSYSNFVSSTTTCFTCMGEDASSIESACAAYNSGSGSTSASSTATASASSTATASASRTSTASASRTSASSSTATSSSNCATNSYCTSLMSTLDTCKIAPEDIGTVSDADMNCMCNSRSFETDITGCFKCLGEDTAGADRLCDSYTSSATVASTRAASTRSSSRSSTAAASPTATSGSGTGLSSGTGSGSESGSGSTTGLTSGIATNQNGAGSRALPGLIAPALVMAAAAWRVMF